MSINSRHKGVGSLIAGLFIILIIISFLVGYLAIQRMESEYTKNLLTSFEEEARRLETSINILKIELISGNTLNITIENDGNVPITIYYIGIFNESRIGSYYNATILNSGEKGVFINPRETKVNITTYETLRENLSSGTWTIQLILDNGLVYSSSYPTIEEITGPQWELLSYIPRNLPEGSVGIKGGIPATTSYNPTNVSTIYGTYISGDVNSLYYDDSNYYIVEGAYTTDTASTSYYPSSYTIINGYYVSGSVDDLKYNDQVYHVIGGFPITYTDTIYTHKETTGVLGNIFYMLKTSSSDSARFVVNGTSSTEDTPVHLATLVYPLRNMNLPSERWWVYYRAWYDRISDNPRPRIYINISILHEDGSSTILDNRFAEASLQTTELTLSDSETFPGYTPLDTDYLVIKFYFRNRDDGVARVYLVLDDSGLALSDQTRIVTTSDIFPTQYSIGIEYIGYSNPNFTWVNLTWIVDSAYSLSNVNVVLQLYDYLNGLYPTSGDGYISYTSSSTPYTDETYSQNITTNPERFRDPSTGEFKLRITAVANVDFNNGVIGKYDLFEFRPTYYINYKAVIEVVFTNLSTKPTIQLDFNLEINHSDVADFKVYLYNYGVGSWESIFSGTYTVPNLDVSYTFSIKNPTNYISSGTVKARLESLSPSATPFQQRTDYFKLNQTYETIKAIYVGRGYSTELYLFLLNNLTWRSLGNAPFNYIPGSSMSYDKYNGLIYAENTTHLFSYDIISNVWTQVSTLPVLGGPGSSLISLESDPGKVYYIPGGTNQLWVYDTSSYTWTRLSDIPEATGSYSIAIPTTDTIYLIVNRYSDGFYKYNITTNTWITLNYTPSSKATGLTYINNKIYLVDAAGSIYEYNIVTDRWRSLSPSIPVSVLDYGNRLFSYDQYLFYIRFDGTREIFRIAVSQLSYI